MYSSSLGLRLAVCWTSLGNVWLICFESFISCLSLTVDAPMVILKKLFSYCFTSASIISGMYTFLIHTYLGMFFYYCTFTFTLLWVSRYLIRLSNWHLLHLIASSPTLNICSNFILMFTHLKYTYKYSYGYEMVCSNIPYLFHNIESCNKGADTEHLIRLMWN